MTDAYTCVTNTLTKVHHSRSPVPLHVPPHATSGLLPANGVGFAVLELRACGGQKVVPSRGSSTCSGLQTGDSAGAAGPCPRPHLGHLHSVSTCCTWLLRAADPWAQGPTDQGQMGQETATLLSSGTGVRLPDVTALPARHRAWPGWGQPVLTHLFSGGPVPLQVILLQT